MLGIAGAAVLAMSTSGCNVDPYCLDCAHGDAGRDGGGREGGVPPDSSVEGGTDAGVDSGPIGCTPGAIELCNLHDDNCDGVVDEGINTMTDIMHCGGCDMPCRPPHAFPVCTDGVCGRGDCNVGYYDINGSLDDGCEYPCIPTFPDDTLCDRADNDCDGEVDEDIVFATDIVNCGSCANTCSYPHASGICTAGVCSRGPCDEGFYDIDRNPANGCEYSCTPAEPPTEECNRRDDDCDGTVDDGPTGTGVPCGTDVGACTRGITACVAGAIACMGSVAPSTEICDGLDNDCDGMIDQGNPGGGGLCGSATGSCRQGRQTCSGGSLMCIGEVGPIAEVCNTFDDDCDSRIDEGNPEGGGACGTDTGDCVAGTRNCRGGTLVCEGSVGPGTEGCDGGDDDCDGRIDEGNPGGGGSCGTDIGQCNPGTNTCTGGSVMCTGAVLPVAEACDSLDNDCDTRIDEGNPGGGAMCGTDTGECTAGTRTCAGGTLACSGERGPAIEACDSLDNDCDARIDEAFSLTTDVNNCGRCGNVCNLAFAIERCTSGTCGILACESGHYDIDHIASNGCEYACDFSGSEVCNSRDDNCDGTVDNGLTPPMICLRAGVCTGTTATCSGTGGWVCSYPSTYQSTETSCDRLDNDCDGAVDEPFPLWGTACSNGVGSCRRTGTYVCNTAGDNVVCNAPAAGLPGTELCDNADNDCDGNTDESIPLASIPTVAVPRAGGGTVNVMTYEASRADATATAEGTATVVACSNSNVIPWTNLTWSEAHAACCALNPGRTCSTSGWRLCDEPDWETACEGSAGTCTWSYASSCTASQPVVCNGDEYDCVSGMSGDQDCLFSTASPVFPMCYANWGANRIYDLSGNVKEWTETARGTGFHAIRGGSYTNVEAGRTCQFAFTVGSDTFRFPNTGFRCCYY